MDTTRKRRLLIAILGVASAGAAPNVQAQVQLIDIGPYGPAVSMNNSGEVALRGHVYSNGTLTALPAGMIAGSINSTGDVVGTVNPNRGLAVYSNGTAVEYPTGYGSLDPAVSHVATGINAGGVLVGYYTLFRVQQSFRIDAGVRTSLWGFPADDPCQTSNGPGGINDAGAMAFTGGTRIIGDCRPRAYLLDQGVWTDLGLGEARAINENGEITGTRITLDGPPYYNEVSREAFLYSGGVVHVLPGGRNITGRAINASAFIVGDRYFFNGAFNDLNAYIDDADPLKPHVTLTDARGITDDGWIVINGTDSRDSQQHAYLMQVPLVRISSGPLDFSLQELGTTSATQTATFTNEGVVAVALGTPHISGEFDIAGSTCVGALAPAAQCTIDVTFSPTVAGDPEGGLVLPVDGVPLMVPLSGSAALEVTLSTSATEAFVGEPFTLTWNASPGASCIAQSWGNDDWSGAISVSGAKEVAERVAVSRGYRVTCTAGSQTAGANVVVDVTWSPVTVDLSASRSTVTAGEAVMLTWTAGNATSCSAAGGGVSDGWAGERSTGGNVSVVQPFALTAPSVNLTYTLTCVSEESGLSASASTDVIVMRAAADGGGGARPSRGGGGGFDLATLLLLGLTGAGFLRRARQR